MLEKATLAGGCFWCLEAVYQLVEGVKSITSGYAGGHTPNPTYEEVCSGNTNHVEVVQLEFDPTVVSYEKLLDIFFTVHDPTTLNRQGADVGTQYRSAIFTHSPEQMEIAQRKIESLNAEKRWNHPIVTTVDPLDTFFKAEDYHQNYFANHPYDGYCRIVITPKVRKYKDTFLTKA
ncbi:MAG: peptide-methionine (S)-S-oxide reductase MsrA [Anaerolineae bacterium]|nr:peptide-methionine (S)-S-oxide reductase MsrA [Anaerolineae bacterium]